MAQPAYQQRENGRKRISQNFKDQNSQTLLPLIKSQGGSREAQDSNKEKQALGEYKDKFLTRRQLMQKGAAHSR
jgi:hypothetical protein